MFDLQLFGGKGGSSTTVQSYKPTSEEVRMQKQTADYAEAVAPNALTLNNYAMNLLKNSLGTVQVDYNNMNKTAQNQISNATNNMSALASDNNASAATANKALGNISNQTGSLANNTASAYGNLSGNYTNASNTANSALNNVANKYNTAESSANKALGGLGSTYTNAANTANQTLGSLAQGNVPSAYQENMEKSIQSALNNTIGKTVSSLGNRGILNSSVTTGALNDIEKNASDAVAQQYQQNISQAANLAQQQYGNSTNSANSLGQLAQQQYQNSVNTAEGLGQTAQQRYQNNVNTANSLGDIIGKKYDVSNAALGQQGQYAQQQFENTQNKNSQNSGLYSNLINSATTPITTAAAAQEAAITPAQSLWNSSLGLNGAATSALSAAAGKGTTTTTQTMNNSGGGFLSGLVGGMANGLGGALFCFPAGTKISMADGTEKDIRHIEEGDKVATMDGGESIVVETMKPHYNDVYNIVCERGHTSTTLSQPLMKIDGEYILAGDMKIGTDLKNVGKVKSIIYSGERKVYDFKTSDDNHYIADGFVAMGGSGEIWGQ